MKTTTEVRDNHNRFWVEQFNQYQRTDSEGCDDGDYVNAVQIRLERDNTVYLSYQEHEQSKLKTVTVPYKIFFKTFVKMCDELKSGSK